MKRFKNIILGMLAAGMLTVEQQFARDEHLCIPAQKFD